MSDNTFDPKHPHEPEIPPHFDADGRCLICVMICKRDNAIRERDEWAAMCGRYKQERVDARQQYDDLAAEHMLTMNKLAEERDEARERERIAALVHKALYDTVERERDETTQERDGALALLALTEEFLALLGDELHETAVIATLHGWKSRRYEQGKILREKIKQLKEKSKLTK